MKGIYFLSLAAFALLLTGAGCSINIEESSLQQNDDKYFITSTDEYITITPEWENTNLQIRFKRPASSVAIIGRDYTVQNKITHVSLTTQEDIDIMESTKKSYGLPCVSWCASPIDISLEQGPFNKERNKLAFADPRTKITTQNGHTLYDLPNDGMLEGMRTLYLELDESAVVLEIELKMAEYRAWADEVIASATIVQ